MEPPAGPPFDGKSLLPLLTGEATKHHETLFWCKDGGEWAVRRDEWKLRSVKGQIELFDLADDPSETTNLADSRPEIVRALNDAFDAWIAQMADPLSGANKPGAVDPSKPEPTEGENQRRRIRAKRKAERAAAKVQR